jgi:hypothetical protein
VVKTQEQLHFRRAQVDLKMQINLHHTKAEIALLCQKLATGEADIVLIQESWVLGDQITEGGHFFCRSLY